MRLILKQTSENRLTAVLDMLRRAGIAAQFGATYGEDALVVVDAANVPDALKHLGLMGIIARIG